MGRVRRDTVEPRGHTGLSAKTVESTIGREKGVPGDILDILGCPHHPEGHVVHEVGVFFTIPSKSAGSSSSIGFPEVAAIRSHIHALVSLDR